MQAFKNFRTYFLRGLAALLPTILTIWIFAQGIFFIRDNVSVHVNTMVAKVLVNSIDWYPQVSDEQFKKYAIEEEKSLKSKPQELEQYIQDEEFRDKVRIEEAKNFWVRGHGQITGFLIVFFGVCFLGAFLASVAGRSIWHALEKMIMNLPLVKKIYPYIKQVTDLMLTKKELAFSKVVAVEYPRKGIWSIGLVTGKGLKKVVGNIEKNFLTVFIPSSPTPFTGYVIMADIKDTIDLEMSIEEALRFTISGGVVTPSEHEAFKALSTKEKNKTDDDNV